MFRGSGVDTWERAKIAGLKSVITGPGRWSRVREGRDMSHPPRPKRARWLQGQGNECGYSSQKDLLRKRALFQADGEKTSCADLHLHAYRRESSFHAKAHQRNRRSLHRRMKMKRMRDRWANQQLAIRGPAVWQGGHAECGEGRWNQRETG